MVLYLITVLSISLALYSEWKKRFYQKKTIELETELKFIKIKEKELLDQVKVASHDVFSHMTHQFLELASARFDTFQTKQEGKLHLLLHPIKESLLKVDHKMEELERKRIDAFSSMKEHMIHILDASNRLKKETENLTKALRLPHVRGRWGEMQLKRVVEMAGMIEYCDFVSQETAEKEGKKIRPDLIIKLPNQKTIVVDAKTPLLSYLDALEEEDPDRKKEHLMQYSRTLKNHIQMLSSKNYWEQFQPTPEFVILFLPAEPFFSAALEQDPTLIEWGVEKKVILATPTTLIALLRSVAYGWRGEEMNKVAKEIFTLGTTLYDRLKVVSGHFQDLKRSLQKSVESFNKVSTSFESRVLVSARRFQEIDPLKEEIPLLTEIDTI